MANINRTMILGNLLYFARNGVADAELGNVSATHCPATGAAVWESLGGIEALSVESKSDDLVIKTPAPGAYATRKTLITNQEMMLTGEMQDMNQIMFEALYRLPAAIVIGTAQQPLKQTGPITGWIKHLMADHTDTAIGESFLYVELKVKPLKTAEKLYKYELEARVLNNSLNTFELVALAAN